MKARGIVYIEAAISGPKSFSGRRGISPIECTGVTFKFENRESFCGGPNQTGTTQGQMHEFLFIPK